MTNQTPAVTQFSLALRGPLDGVAVASLAAHADRLAGAQSLRVNLRGLSTVDPVAVAQLWRLGRALQVQGRSLVLEGLPRHLARRLRLHPVMAFVDGEDAVFTDPFEPAVASAR
ncbi:MAG: hypothetical protein MUC69_07070 [Gemmatimonadales bacterium]|nr:hypothetical protein [Gemmatimonadales bacterium]